MRGWLLAEIQFGAETVEHLQCLLPFNGSELRIRWQGPATDLQPIWNFIQRAIAMPLANYQEVLVSFWPALPLEELRADVFTGFRMVPSMEGDQWIYTQSSEGLGTDLKRRHLQPLHQSRCVHASALP
ncbi:unnamed protein product, partial [Mesorhabditis spiculigera]